VGDDEQPSCQCSGRSNAFSLEWTRIEEVASVHGAENPGFLGFEKRSAFRKIAEKMETRPDERSPLVDLRYSELPWCCRCAGRVQAVVGWRELVDAGCATLAVVGPLLGTGQDDVLESLLGDESFSNPDIDQAVPDDVDDADEGLFVRSPWSPRPLLERAAEL
jgi:hypothetical protein